MECGRCETETDVPRLARFEFLGVLMMGGIKSEDEKTCANWRI